jgi:hypothetical protein
VGYIDLDKAGQLLRDTVRAVGAPVGAASEDWVNKGLDCAL